MWYNTEMEKLYPPYKAAEILGVSVLTLQRWDRSGKIRMVRTPTDRRRVPESEIKRLLGNSETPKTERVLAIYARVSSHEQKAKGELDRQVEFIAKQFDARLYEDIMVVAEVSSGLNDNRKGLVKLMKLAKESKITDIAITYKDRLTRFGFNYLKLYFESHEVKIHVINSQQNDKTMHEELAEDLLAIVTSFSGKLYGIRKKKKESFKRQVKEAIISAVNLPDED